MFTRLGVKLTEISQLSSAQYAEKGGRGIRGEGPTAGFSVGVKEAARAGGGLGHCAGSNARDEDDSMELEDEEMDESGERFIHARRPFTLRPGLVRAAAELPPRLLTLTFK